MPAEDFDATRARLEGPDLFERFRVTGRGTAVCDAGLPSDEPLIVFERGGSVGALRLRQMTYHHVAQGELAGEPYVVSF